MTQNDLSLSIFPFLVYDDHDELIGCFTERFPLSRIHYGEITYIILQFKVWNHNIREIYTNIKYRLRK